jgi:mannose-6-phosphate isomerase-like protein (cupin superfamily)
VIVSDGTSPRSFDAVHVAGLRTELLWQTTDLPSLPNGIAPDPVNDASTFLPRFGETSIQVVTFPADTGAVVAPAEQQSDYSKAFPGLSEHFESKNPGMHVTDTVDYCILLEGELVMELDDGATVVLRQNDVVIQNGTRHGWRNRSERSATMLFVMIGAARSASRS